MTICLAVQKLIGIFLFVLIETLFHLIVSIFTNIQDLSHYDFGYSQGGTVELLFYTYNSQKYIKLESEPDLWIYISAIHLKLF